MSCPIVFVSILLLLSEKVLLGISAETIPQENCGQRSALIQPLVSHGDQSYLGQWPWHVAVMQRMKRASPIYACGGTIITSNFILTAAYCTYPPSRVRRLNSWELLIRAGISNLLQLEDSLQSMMVEKVTVHEDYQPEAFVNDIALLKLSRNLEFTEYVTPICLWWDDADEKLIVGKLGYIPGWGRNERNELSDQLHHAVMPIVSREVCRDSDRKYYNTSLFDWKCFCAGLRNGKSVGMGDIGGGLYIERDGKWILRGVVSSGKYNRALQFDTYSYMVFADVAHFVPWINNKTRISNAETIQPVENYFTCGKIKVQQFFRAVFGKERILPWDGDVYREGQNSTWLCKTAVIKENFVLSPATPFSYTDIGDPSQIVVVFTRNKSKTVQLVQRIVRHPKFTRETGIGNLVLLELKVPLKFSDLIRPICLWETNQNTVKTKDIFDLSTCVTEFKLNSTMLGNYSLCQLHGTTEKTMPELLYVQYDNTWYLRGISFRLLKSQNNNSKKFYIAAADLAHYRNWIEENAVVKSRNFNRKYLNNG